jgi:superfamily II DNA or RNA helicase
LRRDQTYEELLLRIEQLEKENQELRIRCGLTNKPTEPAQIKKAELIKLSPEEKIEIFRGLFRGRNDVFAMRWYSQTTGKSGYQPACENEWANSLCDKKKFKCSDCPNRKLKALNYQSIYDHLVGKEKNGRDVIGIYAICEDDRCYFLCADFDDKSCEYGYKSDVLSFVAVCDEWQIPVAIERSRSGNGAHVWIFFMDAIPAIKARHLGYAILNEAMNRSGRISFKSYDRFIPNQDCLSTGGFGNLIALPLQGMARRNGNSVFVNRCFEPLYDQWAYLKSIRKIEEADVDNLIREHYRYVELAKTSQSEPWKLPSNQDLAVDDFNGIVTLVRSNQIYIQTSMVAPKVVNYLRRLASFKNPEFYSKQAMRFSTFSIPRVISCAELTDGYIALPRGCEDAIVSMLTDHKICYEFEDKRIVGTTIDTRLNIELYANQKEAVEKLLEHTNGVLSATTAFGKTIAAIGLISQLNINTLILVHTKALQTQWIEKLNEFLDVAYSEPKQPQRKGRKTKFSPIGFGKKLHGIIDVVTIQSCISDKNVKDFVNDYGLVIVDECHHVSAVSFEQVLKSIKAKYVYGLTATPIRKDGLQPIIFMQCGPIRYKFDSKQQIEKQTFSRSLISRFTSFRSVISENPTYTQLKKEIAADDTRNMQIIDDVRKVLAEGRTPIIITMLRSHVATLALLLKPYVQHVIELVGSNSNKKRKLGMEQLHAIPKEEQLVIVATGKYVGEGFDYPRLDTLFLAIPVSWKGIVEQYAGRLHRDYEGKQNVRIYDYVDIHDRMCEKMYRGRLKGYASVGYKVYVPSKSLFDEDFDTIFDGTNFETQFIQTLNVAEKSVVICAPQIKFRNNNRVVEALTQAFIRGVPIWVFTQEQSRFTDYLIEKGVVIRFTLAMLCCAVIDKSITWYGTINYLGYNSVEQNAIKINSITVAADVLSSVSDKVVSEN